MGSLGEVVVVGWGDIFMGRGDLVVGWGEMLMGRGDRVVGFDVLEVG